MKSRLKSLSNLFIAVCLLATVLMSAAAAHAQTVLWASEATGTASSPTNAAGAPDGRMTTLSASNYLELRNFRGGFHPGLAALLGIAPDVLARADVIAFEGNGGHPGESGGWESCHWIFRDGTNTYSVDFNATVDWRTIPGVVANGSINTRSYEAFFGASDPLSNVTSYILFDLPSALNITSTRFSIRVSGGLPGEGEGTPDPDAIGLLVSACASEFRVDYTAIEATPVSYEGACPATINFNGKIQTNGPGRVKYRFIRSDGATSAIQELEFDRAEVKYVSTTWTLGDALLLPYYAGWVAIQILSPNPMESNHADFKVLCTGK